MEADAARRGKTINLTPYLFTAISVYAERTAALIESGADLDQQDKQGMTALMYAVSYIISSPDYYETMQIKNTRSSITMRLIKAGANIRIKNSKGQTAYDILMQTKGLLGTEAHWELKVLMAE